MGFLQAIYDLGSLDTGEGLEPYLKFPFENRGKVIRVFLAIKDLDAEVLEVQGVNKVDLASYKAEPDMKLKYLYRDRVGSNVTWGFTPLYKLGKPKGNKEKNREDWLGPDGNWQEHKGCHFNNIKKRVLQDYETSGTLAPGSVDVIMAGLEQWLDTILENLQAKASHIVVFGADHGGRFIYPGEIKAFIHYFETKLEQSLAGNTRGASKACAFCGRQASNLATLDSVFKFATMDKVNFLPGQDKKEEGNIFPLCQECLKKVSAGRERVERTLTSTGVIPGLRVWIIPETVTINGGATIRPVVQRLEQLSVGDTLTSLGERTEGRYFTHLAREGGGLVFHFLFWERNNAQELVHLMVEDVPPERLAFLEKIWNQAMKAVMGKIEKGLNLDWAFASLYATLNRFAGKSDADKLVFRDFALKVIGKMLKGELLPEVTFKKIVTSRAARLVYENDNWDDVKKSLLYAQVWAEYMTLINRG